MRASGVIAVVSAILVVGGCAVKPLKAPCARDEGPATQPLSYASLGPRHPLAVDDACGPMRPINSAPIGKAPDE